MKNKQITWIFSLKQEVPQFLNLLRGKKRKGFFHYSLSGDLYGEKIKWGLGNTVFAIKIYSLLNLLPDLPSKDKKAMAEFIQSFQKKDGAISDPLIWNKSLFRNFLEVLKNRDFRNIFGQETIRAETRQAISALKLIKEKPDIIYKDFPQTKRQIQKYLNKLNWRKPWAAGSQFSHLIFFLKNSDLKNKEILINFAIDWVNRLQNPKDGFWYQDNPSLQQKINGAMKIITGFVGGDKMNFQHPKKLIDLSLAAKNDKQACDNLNIIYVLHHANKVTGSNYRFDEIRRFAINRLAIYRNYYFPEIGGFSFLPRRSNIYYYKAKVSRGLYEPDIHGTCLFLWGISIIAQILGIAKELDFKELVT